MIDAIAKRKTMLKTRRPVIYQLTVKTRGFNMTSDTW